MLPETQTNREPIGLAQKLAMRVRPNGSVIKSACPICGQAVLYVRADGRRSVHDLDGCAHPCAAPPTGWTPQAWLSRLVYMRDACVAAKRRAEFDAAIEPLRMRVNAESERRRRLAPVLPACVGDPWSMTPADAGTTNVGGRGRGTSRPGHGPAPTGLIERM